MAASYQAKDSLVLAQQLKVQEIVLLANNPLISDDTTNLVLQLNETPLSVLACIKQVAAGTVTGVHCTVSGTTIIITGETGAAATTSYIIKYTTHQ